MDLLRDDVAINKDAGTNDAAHHDHGGVEQAYLASQFGGRHLVLSN
jgi:hypothetical protein